MKQDTELESSENKLAYFNFELQSTVSKRDLDLNTVLSWVQTSHGTRLWAIRDLLYGI